MQLPVEPPIQPMLAKAAVALPHDALPGGWCYEPKWDGFRALVFRDGDEIELQSRSSKDLASIFRRNWFAGGLAAKCVAG